MVTLDPASLCEGESVVLDATQPFAAQYSWSTGSTAPTIQVTTPGDYFVSVMTECYFAEGSVLVSAAEDCNPNIYIPNVFSPNGDGVNDVWKAISNDPNITGIQCRVFNRWGNTVFGTNVLPVSWDGMFNGKEMDPGVYVYVLKFQEEGGDNRILSGDVTLIRQCLFSFSRQRRVGIYILIFIFILINSSATGCLCVCGFVEIC